MGKHYDQLDLDDRIEIGRLHAGGISRSAIGRMMGRPTSTIGRELRRNSLRRRSPLSLGPMARQDSLVAVSLAAHRDQEAVFLEAFLIVARAVLAAAIAVVNAPWRRLAQGGGHIRARMARSRFRRLLTAQPIWPRETTPRSMDRDRRMRPWTLPRSWRRQRLPPPAAVRRRKIARRFLLSNTALP